MKYHSIKNIFLYGTMAVAANATLCSCEDFLTITPTNRIVEEDYWEDKNDLLNTVNACYGRLVKEDLLVKYIQWGEMRSDNFEKNSGVTNNDVTNLMNANLLPTNGMFDWTDFYNEINYCNKVLAHGDAIIAKDESFSVGDWKPIKAEMLALRALSHFYLVRTFGEIPYVTIDYNNNGQDLRLPQSTQIEVLDSIIMDLEEAKDIAMNDYGTNAKNKGRITKKSVYTLLADVYLWRASYKDGMSEAKGSPAEEDYQKCVECCDWVIEQMLADYKKSINKSGQVIGGVDEVSLSDLFIQNALSASTYGYLDAETPYTSIFGTGNSRESIFELQLDGTNDANTMLTSLFWNIKEVKSGTLVCSNNIIEGVDESPNAPIPGHVFTKTDYRKWETARYTGADQTDFPMAKYTYSHYWQTSTSGSGMNDNNAISANSTTRSLPNSANWIVYRLSDVVLMKAEAMSQLYSDEEHLKEAFALVREVFRRSNPYAYLNKPAAADSLNFEAFNTPDGIESLVMAERQREFFGEGKRWFDLVRYAQRRGNTVEMLTLLIRKYNDNKKAVMAKLASMKSLFSPIYTYQMRNNTLLHQNEVWETSKNTSRIDETN